MKELDVVALEKDFPAYGLTSGDLGTIVLVHDDGKGYEVEFATLAGAHVAVLTLPGAAIRPIGPDEIAHARRVA